MQRVSQLLCFLKFLCLHRVLKKMSSKSLSYFSQDKQCNNQTFESKLDDSHVFLVEQKITVVTFWYLFCGIDSTVADFFIIILKNLLLLFFGCVGSLLLCAGSLYLQRAGALLCGVWASHCHGFSCCGARASVVVACGLSSCGLWALERRLSSCGARAQLLHSMWNLPGSGLEQIGRAHV